MNDERRHVLRVRAVNAALTGAVSAALAGVAVSLTGGTEALYAAVVAGLCAIPISLLGDAAFGIPSTPKNTH